MYDNGKGGGEEMTSRRAIAIGAAVVLILVSIGFRFATSVASNAMTGFFDEVEVNETILYEDVLLEGDASSQIAVLSVNGVIDSSGAGGWLTGSDYDHDKFMTIVEHAATDDSVAAIMLEIDSPGGAVSTTEEMYRALVEFQEEYDKPFYVSMGDYAASGGYYIAAPADKIFAESATITGSIGVIMESMNFSKLAENYGIEVNTIKSGKHKDIMSAYREMTEEEEGILQSMIDEMFDEFVDVIVDGRDMDEKTVRKLADGRIYTGSQAQEVDLVDEIGSFDDALQALMEDYDLENAQVIQYDLDDGLFNFFGFKVQNIFQTKHSEIDMIMELMNQSDKPRAMYLY